LREFLPFTPEIREILLDVPPERLIWKTEELLNEDGQTMQQAAQRAYDEGKIGREWLPVDYGGTQKEESTDGTANRNAGILPGKNGSAVS
jgi:hypothetical protein